MKILRLSFVLLLVFSAITISAVAGSKNGSLSLEIDGKHSVVSESFEKAFFKIDETSLEIISFGQSENGITDVEIKKGLIKGQPATLFNLPLDGRSSVIEIDGKGFSTVKLGEIEKLVGLGDERNLNDSQVILEKNLAQ